MKLLKMLLRGLETVVMLTFIVLSALIMLVLEKFELLRTKIRAAQKQSV